MRSIFTMSSEIIKRLQILLKEYLASLVGKKKNWSPTMFQGMHRLWLLHIPLIFPGFPRGLQYLPESLKCLIINYCPWKSLPSHFMAPNLVELRMPRSNLVQLWSEVPNLGNLKYVDLSGSIDLTEISALSQAPNLVSVDLSFCASLHQVPPLRFRIGDKLTSSDQSHNNCYYDECRTLGHLKLDHCIRLKVVEKISGNLIELHLSNSTSIEELSSSICSLYDLVYLNLSRCRRLKRLPSDIQILKSLKRLNLNGCSSFDTLPVLPRSLIELDLTGTSIEEVPSSSIEHLFSLEKLMLYDCKRLKSLPTGIKLKSLKELELKHCINLKIFPAILEPMEHLQTLDFRQTGIRVLTSLANLPILMSLDLSSCKISEIPNDVGCLSSIVRLSLCSTLVEELPFSICTLHDLEYLNLCDCDRLKSLPSDMQMLKSLTRLDLNGCSSFGKLPVLPRSLIELDLTATPIEEVPSSSIEHLFGLEKLTLHDCEILTSLPSDMQMLKSLTRLDLKGCSSFDKLPVLPRSLIKLDLTGTSIEEVPSSSIEYLFGLEELTLHGCKRLKSLPSDMQMLKSLTRLDLKGCSSFDKLPVLPRSLIELDLTGTSIEEVPSSSIEHLFGLEKLTLHGCKRLNSLPSDMQMLKSLTRLDLKGCSSFDKLPVLPRSLIELDLTGTSIEELPSSSIEHLFGLEKLTLHGCESLKSLPSDMQMLKSLTRLDLKGCSSFDKLPMLPRSLIELDLIGTSIEEVPSSSIEHLFGLEKLTLHGCKRLKSLPSDMQMLKSLTRLDLKGCSSFDKLPVLPRSLIELDLTGTSIEELPSSSIEHLFGLEKLTLHGCESLKSLPTGICKLKSLKELELTHCKNLEIFPAIKNLSKLIVLFISNCKMLKSLPELPLSLELLDASGCTSLGRIANSRDALLQGLRSGNHVITSTEFFYVDCLNLDQNMCNNIMSEFQLRTLDMSTKSIQPHVGLNTSDCPCVSICCPGNKIPMWFTHQLESTSINIRLSPDWKNTNFLGFALCVVVSNGKMSLNLWCEANFKTNNGESYEFSWDLNDNRRTAFLDSNSSNLFMWYKPENYHNCLDTADVSFCFFAGSRENKVRACGVRPLYLQDAKELGITNELGKSNATSTGAVTCTSDEPHIKRIKTGTSDCK